MKNENKVYELSLDDGKYTIRLSDDCRIFEADRYGERWQTLHGNNLVLNLVWKIQELEEKIKTLEHNVQKG